MKRKGIMSLKALLATTGFLMASMTVAAAEPALNEEALVALPSEEAIVAEEAIANLDAIVGDEQALPFEEAIVNPNVIVGDDQVLPTKELVANPDVVVGDDQALPSEEVITNPDVVVSDDQALPSEEVIAPEEAQLEEWFADGVYEVTPNMESSAEIATPYASIYGYAAAYTDSMRGSFYVNATGSGKSTGVTFKSSDFPDGTSTYVALYAPGGSTPILKNILLTGNQERAFRISGYPAGNYEILWSRGSYAGWLHGWIY